MTVHRDFDYRDGQLVERHPRPAPAPSPQSSPQQELFPPDLRRSFLSSFSVGDQVRVITHGGLWPVGCLPDTKAWDCYGVGGAVEKVEHLEGGPAYTVYLETGFKVRVGAGALEHR